VARNRPRREKAIALTQTGGGSHHASDHDRARVLL